MRSLKNHTTSMKTIPRPGGSNVVAVNQSPAVAPLVSTAKTRIFFIDKLLCWPKNVVKGCVSSGFNQSCPDRGQNSLAFAAIPFAAIRRYTGWWPATVATASYLLPRQEGVTSNCSKRAICCNYLERILTPCPAYLCGLKYLGYIRFLLYYSI